MSNSNPLSLMVTERTAYDRLWNRLVRIVAAQEPSVAPHGPLMLTRVPDGPWILTLKKPEYRPSGVSEHAPFELYQYTPDPASPSPDDWRTVRVTAGTINNQHPDNDDSQASPIDITAPALATLYKVWLDCDVVTADGATQGTLSAGTIASGSTGWSGYPAQPDPNLVTGAPPSKLYVLLGELTTSSDTDKKLTIVQNVDSSLWADMVGFNLVCSDSTHILLQKRMTVHRV